MFKGTPNTNGRPKGSTNKATNKVRKAFTLLVENNLEKMQEDLISLDPKDRIKLMLEMSSFIIPKLKSVEMQADINNNEDLLNRLLEIPKENYNKLYDRNK